MSVRSKVNVVNSVQYSSTLRRFIAEGKDETSAGIFSSGNHAWVTNGDKLSIVDTAKGYPRPTYSFGEDSKDPVDITCVEEFVLDCTTPSPLLLVGTSSLYNSQLCVFNPTHSTVIRAIQLDNLQVRCMAIVEDGRSCVNSLTDVLSAMEGVVALGCADGSVVLVDLNRQTIIKAYHGNLLYCSSESTPQSLKFVSTVDEDATIIEITEAQHMGMSSAITLIEGDSKDVEFGVTALTFSKETACLYIGYSSGLWQIWNLSFPTPTMLYECAECTCPVSNFCQIEPCEDPRPTVYLWVNHEGTDSSMPLLNMYSLSYANKLLINDYGIFYQDFINCSLSFSMYPGEEFPNVISGRLVSAKAYSKTIKRHLIQNMGLPEMEGIQMKLVATTFTLTYARGSTHTYLCIFDLDQWYKEQMPHECNCDAPYLETSELSSEPLLASTVLIDSISLYHTEEPQEIHLVPQALSFKVVGLSENGLMTIEKIGLQKLWLTNTEAIGAKSLIHPTKLFHTCVSAGLVPMFPAHQNPETSLPTNEEMRSYIMSVCLDNGLIQMILEVGEQWESGVHATSNCTLSFLFDWVWSSVSTAYKSVNSICDTLFSASGQGLDVSLKRRLQLCRLILDRLHYIHTAFCSKYSHTLYADTLEPRLKAIEIITLFVHQVSWFVNVGLLPEANSKDLPASAISYDYPKLDRYAVDRRQRLNSLFAKFRRASKTHDMPGAGLYLVDHFVHDYSELGQQWEDEGGSTAYPPPSIQSLLRSLRISTVPTATKLALIQYTLLDIKSVIDKASHEDLLSKVSTFHLLPKINATQTKVINGLWHLDHSFFEEGLQYLLDRTVTVSDLSEGLHRAILRLLLFEGKEKLAIQYLRLKNPPLSLPDDLKLEMSLLLANKLTSEAYHFQREHTYLRETLLRQLFTECLGNGEIGKLLSFHLDESEINFFHSILAKNRCQRNDDLRVLLLITQSKFVEAKALHEKLLASSTDRDQLKASTREMIVNGLASTLCPVTREIYLQKINPNLKNLPEFKSSKPRPLSVYVKTIDDGGFPNFGVSSQKLCASALACSANLWRFLGVKNGNSQFRDISQEESMTCSEQSNSLWSKQDTELPAPGKRGRLEMLGSNKRQKVDEDAAVEVNIIASFVGTPLVKRRSRELADPATPTSTTKRPPVHSILKSGKTPGTPGRPILNVNNDLETPKKTLRWDIPTSEPGCGKEAVKKSLLSTSLLAPNEEEPLLLKSSDTSHRVVQTPQDNDSIRSRLRSHTSSASKKDSAVWAEIAEEAKAKVLFSYNLPSKKEKKSLPAKTVGPSFVVQVNQLIEEERLRKESTSEKGMAWAVGVPPAPKDVKETEKIALEGENADVEMQEEVTPVTSGAKHLRFLNLTVDGDEGSLLELSGSPFTTTAIPKEFRQQLRARLNSPHSQADRGRTAVGDDPESHEDQSAKDVEPIESTSEFKMTPVKRHSKILFAESQKPNPCEDDDKFIVDELPSEESHQENYVTKLPTPTVDAPAVAELSVSGVDTSVKSSAVGDVDPIDSSDAAKADDEFPKIIESNVASDVTKNTTSKDNMNAFTAQITPQIGSVVSLSRGHYAEDEDEVGSEDPEEAEIPPVIEFSQPEEGLVIDASYALKDNSEPTEESEENLDERVSELGDVGVVAEDKPDDDSGSSVICLDSDSDEPKNRTQLDYEDYEEESYSLDSEGADHSSRGRRSFFHDKYNTHQEESEESPSPEYSSGDDEKKESDVDLYNIDDMEENDGMLKDDELDDEIFAMGRGIQERKDLGVSSEEDEEEDLGEEEDTEEEDEIDEEEDEEAAEVIPDIPVSSESSPKRNLPDVDDDIGEALSSDEEDVALIKRDFKHQSSQDSDSGSSRSDVANPITTENDSSKEENKVSTVSHKGMQDLYDEDRSAVDALLGLAEPPCNESDSVKEFTTDVEILTEPQVRESPQNSEQNISQSAPSKATDVIDILNLSQGQMFFGSPEVQICDKPPDRALFQLRTSAFTPRSGKSSDNNDQKEKIRDSEDLKLQSEVDEVSTTEDTLVLRLEESDIVRAKSPDVQSSIIEAIESPNFTGDPNSGSTASHSGTTESLIVKGNELMVQHASSCQVELLENDEKSNQLPPKESVIRQTTFIKSSPSYVSSEGFSCQAATDTSKSESSVISLLNKSPTDRNSVTSTCRELVDPKCKVAAAQQDPSLSPAKCANVQDTGAATELVPASLISSSIKETEGQPRCEVADSSVVTLVHKPPTPFKSFKQVPVETEQPDFEGVDEAKRPDVGEVSLDDANPEEQFSDKVCQCDELSPPSSFTASSCQAELREKVKVPNQPPHKESVVCQTTFIKSSPPTVSSKSFSCQAAMDTTKYGSLTFSSLDIIPPNKTLQDSLIHTSRELIDPENNVVIAEQDPSLSTARCPDVEDTGAATELVPVTPISSSVKEDQPSCEVPDSSITIVLEPPTPFKTIKSIPGETEKPDFKGLNESGCCDIGVASLNEADPSEHFSDRVNQCDMAFVGDTSFTSLTATPKTPGGVTPLRKSLRLARMGTPGRALVPDDEVNVSDSVLDVAVLDPEIDYDKPVLVDKSVVTDKQGLDKSIVSRQSKDLKDNEGKSKKERHKSSQEKPHKELKKKVKESKERDKKEVGVKEQRPESSVVGSVDPEMLIKPTVPSKRRSSVQRDEDQKQFRKSKSSRASSEQEAGERHQHSRHRRASSVDAEHESAQPEETEKGVRRRRSSSVQPEIRDYTVETEKRKGRRSVKLDVPRRKSEKYSSSQMSAGSESSSASWDHDQPRRHSSVEPVAKPRQRGSRRASSEEPSNVGCSSSRKRRSSTLHAEESSSSPSKLRREEPFEMSDNKEYRKRVNKHSITEPLEKKKHQLEEQALGEPSSEMAWRSEVLQEDLSAGCSGSGRVRKSRSLNEFPVRRSVRPSVLESIQELPEDSPRRTHSKPSMRASTDNLTALESLMSNTKRIDISKWMALSSSQVSRGRISVPTRPSKKDITEHLDIGAFLKTLSTPVKEGATSPTGSVVSITSTASSKVLRSGRVIDENTPTKRPRELSGKQRAARSLKLSAESPAKVLRSGRAVGDDDRLSYVSDGEETGGSGNTSLSSSYSAAEPHEHQQHAASMDEILSSRRLTRHQRSILEASTSRGRTSPADASPSSVSKRNSKK